MKGFAHEAVNRPASEYVRQQAHANGIGSFRAMSKRGCRGMFNRFSGKRPDRYAAEFAGRRNDREADAIDTMAHMAQGIIGKRLMYKDSIA